MSGGATVPSGFNIEDLLNAKPGSVIRCNGDPSNFIWRDSIAYPAHCNMCGGPTTKAKHGRCHYCGESVT